MHVRMHVSTEMAHEWVVDSGMFRILRLWAWRVWPWARLDSGFWILDSATPPAAYASRSGRGHGSPPDEGRPHVI